MRNRALTLTAAAAIAGALALAAALPADAVQELPAGPNHRGVATVDVYQIFPENRPGNAVYFDNRLVFTLPNQTIRHLLPLPKEGRFAYLVEDPQGKRTLGVYVEHQDPPPRIMAVDETVFHVVVVLDGVVYKKLYRIFEGNRLQDLLPTSKTADGAVSGPAGVVFYHVASVAERQTETGEAYNEFAMRVHLVVRDDPRVRDLEYPVFNTLPKLELGFGGPQEITYKLADGRVETLSLSQFQ